MTEFGGEAVPEAHFDLALAWTKGYRELYPKTCMGGFA